MVRGKNGIVSLNVFDFSHLKLPFGALTPSHKIRVFYYRSVSSPILIYISLKIFFSFLFCVLMELVLSTVL